MTVLVRNWSRWLMVRRCRMALENSNFGSHLGVFESEIVGFSAGSIEFVFESLEASINTCDLILLLRNDLGLALVLTDSF